MVQEASRSSSSCRQTPAGQTYWATKSVHHSSAGPSSGACSASASSRQRSSHSSSCLSLPGPLHPSPHRDPGPCSGCPHSCFRSSCSRRSPCPRHSCTHRRSPRPARASPRAGGSTSSDRSGPGLCPATTRCSRCSVDAGTAPSAPPPARSGGDSH